MNGPRVRTQGLTSVEIGDDLFVHDSQTQYTHQLNRTSATIFRRCDGNTTLDELVALLPPGTASEALALSAIAQFGRAGLLAEPFPTPEGISRRRFVSAAVAAPLVISVLAPRRSAAASPAASDGTNAADPGDGADVTTFLDDVGASGGRGGDGTDPKTADPGDGVDVAD